MINSWAREDMSRDLKRLLVASGSGRCYVFSLGGWFFCEHSDLSSVAFALCFCFVFRIFIDFL